MAGQEPELTPELLLTGYANGIFPMAEARDNHDLHWVDPRQRGIVPLDGFRLSRSLRKRIRQDPFTLHADTAFADVVQGCADREETWINAQLFDLYQQLFHMGRAHSLEVWEDDTLVGGVFGLTLGAAFFGESMFSHRKDASKIALAYLVDRLRLAGFTLFDTQFLTPHLASLGAIEIPRARYRVLLAHALEKSADFASPGPVATAQALLQRSTHTS